jgi:hypothetical protein
VTAAGEQCGTLAAPFNEDLRTIEAGDMLGSSERERVHTRRIVCEAYRRQDGLWEIEATVVDEKGEDMPFRSRPMVRPGEALHDMTIALLIGDDAVIRDVGTRMRAVPWGACPESLAAYRRLIGLQIGAGFMRAVRERVGGVEGCTHLTDLIVQIGNTYTQASWPTLIARQFAAEPDPRKWSDRRAVGFVGACKAWRADGPTVRQEYPELAEDAAPASDDGQQPGPR